MTKKNWLTLFLFLFMCCSILFGGLYISKLVSQSYKGDIDKNGAVVKAIIFIKTANAKGSTVYFRYKYKNSYYTNQEDGRALYDKLNDGDTITIKIDSLYPDNSYIMEY